MSGIGLISGLPPYTRCPQCGEQGYLGGVVLTLSEQPYAEKLIHDKCAVALLKLHGVPLERIERPRRQP